MGASPSRLRLLAVLCALPMAGVRADEPPKQPVEKPLPVARTTVVRDADVVYVVEGRQTIPAGVEVTLQKGVRVLGKKGGVLEVRGALVAHGIPGTSIVWSGLRIELAESVQQLHLDHCRFEGGAGVGTPEGKATSGMLTIENCNFGTEPGPQVSITKGKLNLMSVIATGPTRLTAIDVGETPNTALGLVYGCRLFGGLEAENFADLTVRTSLLKGSPLVLRKNRTLLFDANRVESGRLDLEQAKAGLFRGTKFTKCDLLCETVRFFAPADPAVGDSVILDKCWFAGRTDDESLAKIIEDAADDPKNNVKVRVKSPSDRPNDAVKPDKD